MDNYLLMGHILTCKIIPKDEVHPELWVGANKKWRAVPTSRVARMQHNKVYMGSSVILDLIVDTPTILAPNR
jgi:hypothetical protein